MPQTNGYCLLDKWLAQKTNCLVKKDGLFTPFRLSFTGIISCLAKWC